MNDEKEYKAVVTYHNKAGEKPFYMARYLELPELTPGIGHTEREAKADLAKILVKIKLEYKKSGIALPEPDSKDETPLLTLG